MVTDENNPNYGVISDRSVLFSLCPLPIASSSTHIPNTPSTHPTPPHSSCPPCKSPLSFSPLSSLSTLPLTLPHFFTQRDDEVAALVRPISPPPHSLFALTSFHRFSITDPECAKPVLLEMMLPELSSRKQSLFFLFHRSLFFKPARASFLVPSSDDLDTRV